MTDGDSPEFDGLLEYLKRTRGFDFNAYKRPSLTRRIQKRMQSVHIDRFSDYTDYLEVHPEEFGQLFNVILINVTAFFRDDQSWDFLRTDVIPSITESNGDAVRVWTAGCASGEETYSVAMLLAEALGREQFRNRVKIYATDVDEHALNAARAASYTEKQVEAVPADIRGRYFSREGGRYVFDKDMRRSVIFGRHDLIQDAPISRVNLLVCRNTLMYFNTEAQTRILARFHFALGESGILFLGKAEMLLTHAQLFSPMDLRRRIFRKVSKDNWRDRMAVMNQATGDEPFDLANNHNLYPALFDAGSNAQFVVDNNGLLTMFNEPARTLFGFGPADRGRPVQDLEVSYRPVELRSVIAQVVEQRRPVSLREVQWNTAEVEHEARYFDVHVAPMINGGGRLLGVSVSFVDMSRLHELQLQLDRSRQELETAYEELQSTNEELETTNEELQSTVEELETTNEELQSTNEELETMNEELQSTNEELETINEELRDRSEDLNRSKGFLESILGGVRSGVVVLDRELHVVAWNHRSEDLWGLRSDEVRGQNFFNLDIGLPTDQLRVSMRACLAGDGEFAEMQLPATNRRGKAIMCRVSASPLVSNNVAGHKEVRGVILLMEEQLAPVRVN
jgi:two-component system CheB/CheR fusion protein